LPIIFKYENSITQATNINLAPTISGGYTPDGKPGPDYTYSFLSLPTTGEFSKLKIDSKKGIITGSIDTTGIGNINGTISVQVTDTVNTAHADVAINIPATGIAITSNSAYYQLGDPVLFDVGIIGGTAPYKVTSTNITNIGTGASIDNLGIITCDSFDIKSGTTTVQITITDANNKSITPTVTFTKIDRLEIPDFKVA
jgi:hypothetical protein